MASERSPDTNWDDVVPVFERALGRLGGGGGLCVIHRGTAVVDCAAGYPEGGLRAFEVDDLALVFSATKGMTALAAHHLIDHGALDLDAPVTRYWPEFGAAGKSATTVAMMLNHSAGVAGFHEPLKSDAHLDWEYMTDRIAAEPPFWEPGTRNGYHALNFGWTVGELVRRVAGTSLGAYFREAISAPAEADFWIGLPEAEEQRVAKLTASTPQHDDPLLDIYSNFAAAPESPSALTFANMGGWGATATDKTTGEAIVNTRAVHEAEIGGAGGIGSARGLARIYAALGTESLISRDHVIRMSRTAMVSMRDPILLVPTRFALGFMKSTDNRHRPIGRWESFIIGARAFGHVGFGGSFGFYDPDTDLAVGFVVTTLGQAVFLDERGQAIIDAIYRSLGYRTNAPGVWVR